MNRTSDWSNFLSYLTAWTLALSDKIVHNLDEHAAGIGAFCQIVGAGVVVLTYLWNKSCHKRRLQYYEQNFKEIFERDHLKQNGGDDEEILD